MLYTQESWSRAGILLVRNPFDAYVAEWNRKNSRGHVGLVNQRQFSKLMDEHDMYLTGHSGSIGVC